MKCSSKVCFSGPYMQVYLHGCKHKCTHLVQRAIHFYSLMGSILHDCTRYTLGLTEQHQEFLTHFVMASHFFTISVYHMLPLQLLRG